MKSLLQSLACLLVFVLFCFVVNKIGSTQYTTKVYRTADKLTADVGGTVDLATDTLKVQGRTVFMTTYAADPNATGATHVVSDLDTDDLVIATQNTLPANGAYLLSAVPQVGEVSMSWSADPAESVTISIQVWKD